MPVANSAYRGQTLRVLKGGGSRLRAANSSTVRICSGVTWNCLTISSMLAPA